MNRKLLVLIISLIFVSAGLNAQKKTYFSSAGEMIFSFASIEYMAPSGTTYDKGNIMRWSPVLNGQFMFNYDPTKVLGLFTGFTVRNVGFIYSVPESSFKYKYRTYNLGVPIGLKIGSLKSFFIYGGYEIEFAFNYKEKLFENESKSEKDVYWFTDRVTQFPQSFFVGIDLPYGFNVKFKYYITNFHNQDYTTMIEGETIKPYEDLKSNVFYVSLNFGLFEPFKKYYDPRKWEEVY
jgi:hypothetical protein